MGNSVMSQYSNLIVMIQDRDNEKIFIRFPSNLDSNIRVWIPNWALCIRNAPVVKKGDHLIFKYEAAIHTENMIEEYKYDINLALHTGTSGRVKYHLNYSKLINNVLIEEKKEEHMLHYSFINRLALSERDEYYLFSEE
jgi:hypothetical protein